MFVLCAEQQALTFSSSRSVKHLQLLIHACMDMLDTCWKALALHRCALCHGTEVDEEDGWGRQYRGLGRFMLVRVSIVQVAWVHSQCAWWSPIVSSCPY